MFNSGPSCSKGAIHWITQIDSLIVIRWIAIHPVETLFNVWTTGAWISTNRFSRNRGQVCNKVMSWKPVLWPFHSVGKRNFRALIPDNSFQVLEVEDEMRILLQENALTKKTLEQRLKKLTSAFTEIQHDLAGTWVSCHKLCTRWKFNFIFPVGTITCKMIRKGQLRCSFVPR